MLVDSFVVEAYFDRGAAARTTLKALSGVGPTRFALLNAGATDCVFARVDVWNMRPMGFDAARAA